MRDFLYIEDVASALCDALENNAAGTFNLGSGNSMSLRRYIEIARDCASVNCHTGPIR